MADDGNTKSRIEELLEQIAEDVAAIRLKIAPKDVASLEVTIDKPTKQK